MAYCTIDDLKNELRNFGSLVPKDLDDDAWAAHMIKKADTYINMRLNRRYGPYIPFDDLSKCPSGVPDTVWMISVQLAVYWCLFSNYAGQSSEKIEALATSVYKPAVDMLNWLSKGNLEIPELDSDTDNLLIDSSTDTYATEFLLERKDSEGNIVVDGNMDSEGVGEW